MVDDICTPMMKVKEISRVEHIFALILQNIIKQKKRFNKCDVSQKDTSFYKDGIDLSTFFYQLSLFL